MKHAAYAYASHALSLDEHFLDIRRILIKIRIRTLSFDLKDKDINMDNRQQPLGREHGKMALDMVSTFFYIYFAQFNKKIFQNILNNLFSNFFRNA